MRNTRTYRVVSAPLLALFLLLFFGATTITAAPGDLDPTFGVGGKLTDWEGAALGVAIQQDGKIVIVGGYSIEQGGYYPADFRVARYNPDGTPDTTFGGGTGRVTTDFGGNSESSVSVVIQPDGKIVVAGLSNFGGLAVARYNPDGSLDTSFGGGSGKVLTEFDSLGFLCSGNEGDVAVRPDGKILVVLGNVDFDDNCDLDGLLVRYNPDGSLDTSFGKGGFVLTEYQLSSVTVQPADGKIVAHRFFPRLIARFNPDGSPDTGFGSGGTVTNFPAGFLYSIAIDSAGKIVAAGDSSIANLPQNASTFALFRFNVDGSPDSSFDGDGIVTIPSLRIATSVVIQPDGKIVAAGKLDFPNSSDFALARLNVNGSLDNTFGGGDGITTIDFNNSGDFPYEVVLDRQGRAVVVGDSYVRSGDMFAIARFLGDQTCPNPIDCAEFFVRQQYQDFLNREPDASGLAFWLNSILACGANQSCIDAARVNVSGAFYLSIEFQQSGYLVYRFYKSAFGNLPGAPVPVRLSDFLPDAQAIGQGVIVNQGNWQQQLETNKQNFANAFVQRSAFTSRYPTSMTPDAFVDTLFANAGVSPSSTDRAAAVAEFGSASNTADISARARALRRVADNAILVEQEFNRSFVLMQYFGYLRRNPNDAPEATLDFQGYNFWLNKLNQFNGDYIQAEMVDAFLSSTEYRGRFGL